MNSLTRLFAGLALFLFWLEPAGFALKTEKLFPDPSVFTASVHAKNALEVVSGRILARFSPGTGAETGKRSLAAAGFSILREFSFTGWTLVGLPEGVTVANGLALVKNMPGVEDAEPDRAYRVKRTPDDPLLSAQYALLRVQAASAWEYQTGSSGTVNIAVIDTGIDGTHLELSGKLTGVSQFFDPNSPYAQSSDQPPTPACNHATRVAGVAASSSDNGAGIAGMSWGAKLISLKVFSDADCTADCDNESGGQCATEDATIAQAIDYATNNPLPGKTIINMSLGEANGYPCSAILQDAVNSAYAAGLLLVAAAGNEASSFVDAPARCEKVVPVGATNDWDNRAYFSNYGPEMTERGLSAPGVGLLTTDLNNGYTPYPYASGTSFAAPMVSGLAALVWSAKPDLSPGQVWDVMKNSADDLGLPGADRYFGFGRINAFNSVQYALNGTFVDFLGKYKAYAYPNPFRPGADHMVTFTIPNKLLGEDTELRIYTQEGELVRKLSSPGWDGKNSAGFPVASGVYIFHLKTDKGSAKGKFAVTR